MSSFGGFDSNDGEVVDGQNDLLTSESEYEDAAVAGSDGEQEERYGRFFGPDSSWRKYTQAERTLAATLDQLECNDLSIHLYNAHAWKRRHRETENPRVCKPWHSKNSWIKANEDGKLPFLPHTGWTAWPLKPDDVPRRREEWGVPTTSESEDAGTYVKQQPWKPSDDLKDELTAAILGKAKDRFRRRSWTVQDSETSNHERKANSRLRLKREPNSESVSPTRSNLTPSIMADDEYAGKILQPIVQHIIRQLDQLLFGLHNSRKGHRGERSASGSRAARSQSRSRSRTKVRNTARVSSKRKRVASGATQESANKVEMHSDPDHDSTDAMPSRSANRESRTRQHALVPRDWSEVLGIAAFTGWDQTVLDRAARRCASLFGESMTMRLMPETAAGQSSDRIVEYVPKMFPPSDSDLAESAPSLIDEAAALFYCPYAPCRRHVEPYEKRWRLNDHLKKTHGYTSAEIHSALSNNDCSTSGEELSSEDEGSNENEQNTGGEDLSNVRSITAAVRQDGVLEFVPPLQRLKDKRPKKRQKGTFRTEETQRIIKVDSPETSASAA